MSKPSSQPAPPKSWVEATAESTRRGVLAGTAIHHRQMLPSTMQAMVYRRYGTSQVLEPATLPVPRVKAGEALIRVRAVSVNPIDCRLRSGEARWLLPGHFPRIPGYDVAGEVVIPPLQSDAWRVGDRVLAFLDNIYGGAAAQFVACGASAMQRLPDDLAFVDAAAIPLAGSTALQTLRSIANIKADQRVLINGASGGVGVFAVQIARAYGAWVTAVASGPRQPFLRWLGIDEFIDYQQQDFTRSSSQWDIVFDVAGKSSYWRCRPVLSANGRYVSTEPNVRGLLMSCLTWPLSKRGRVMLAKPKPQDLAELLRLVACNQLKVILDEVFPLHDLAAAHQRMEQGISHGKIVLSVP